MTTVPGDNVFNLAVEGNFDDCQRIVKAAFADQGFLPDGRQLVAVNSINWARILMQIVYYFSAALRLGAPQQPVSFSVPTGNFGDIYAGYLAKHMGLPIERLVVATNKNDILHRFVSANDYSATELNKTYSPSMDILVSSNFERYLFDLFDRNPQTLSGFMSGVGNQSLSVSDEQWQRVREEFDSASVDDETTCQLIAEVFANNGELLDPHTAVGLKAARECLAGRSEPAITLATAHPAKFSDAITAAGLPTPQLPAHLADLFEREERYTVVANELAARHRLHPATRPALIMGVTVERRPVIADLEFPEQLHPLLKRIYRQRHLGSPEELDLGFSKLLPPDQLKGMAAATELLFEALRERWRILIVADFDADGATSCAVVMQALRQMGAAPCGLHRSQSL